MSRVEVDWGVCVMGDLCVWGVEWCGGSSGCRGIRVGEGFKLKGE